MGRAAAATAPRHGATTRRKAKTPSRAPARRSSGSAKGRTGAHTRQSSAAAGRNPAAAGARMSAAPHAVPRTRTRTRTRTRPAPLVQRIARGRLGAALDWILRGRACVFLFGALLAGVVFFNVSLLEKNEGITRTNAKATTIEHQNQILRRKLARLDSSERIQTEAVKRGFQLPAAGDVGYTRGNVNANARKAARVIVAPGTGDGTASRAIGTDHDTAVSGPTSDGTAEAPEPTSTTPQTQTAAPQTQAQAPAPVTPAPTTPAAATGAPATTATGTATTP